MLAQWKRQRRCDRNAAAQAPHTIARNVALFGATGVLALAAAVHSKARLVTAPLLLIGIGFCGRLLSIALSGYEASMLQPMIVEVVLITLFATGRKVLGH